MTKWGLLAIRLGNKKWVSMDMVPPLAATYGISKSEVKRIIRQGGLHLEFIEEKHEK